MSIASELAAVPSTVQRPGDFFASGTAEMLAPRLEVEGVGPVALPLLPIQVQQLVAAADRAPYGRGEATLVDPRFAAPGRSMPLAFASRGSIGGAPSTPSSRASPRAWA